MYFIDFFLQLNDVLLILNCQRDRAPIDLDDISKESFPKGFF